MHNKGRFALIMLVCLGGGIAGFALSKSLPLSYAMLTAVGTCMMAVFATVTSLVRSDLRWSGLEVGRPDLETSFLRLLGDQS